MSIKLTQFVDRVRETSTLDEFEQWISSTSICLTAIMTLPEYLQLHLADTFNAGDSGASLDHILAEDIPVYRDSAQACIDELEHLPVECQKSVAAYLSLALCEAPRELVQMFGRCQLHFSDGSWLLKGQKGTPGKESIGLHWP